MSKTNATKDGLLLRNQVCFPLYSAANAMVRMYRPELDKLDLTYLQYIVMMVLWEKDGINVKELGQAVHLDSGTLTPLLKRLEQKGLIQRKISETDERSKELWLLPAGLELKSQAQDIPDKMLCKTSLTPETLQSLKQACERLIEDVTKRD